MQQRMEQMHAALLKLQTKAELVTQRCQNSNHIPC